MRQWYLISILLLLGICFISGITDPVPKSQYIPASKQRTGNAIDGYRYLITGDYLKSVLPYGYFKWLNGKDKHNYLHREGKNAWVPPGFNVVTAENGTTVVVPTCLQ